MSESDATDAYKVVRALARETFRTHFAAANPEATEAEALAAWQASDKEQLRTLARRTLRLMKRHSISFSVAAE